MKILKIIAAAGISSALLFGCQKETSQDSKENKEVEILTKSSQDDAFVDQIFTEIHEQELGLFDDIRLPNIGLNDYTNVGPDTPRCVTVTIEPGDPLNFPKKVTVDYGTRGCSERNGKTVTGKMVTEYTAPMFIPGARAITRFENYVVDGVKIEGTHITKNNSTATAIIFTRTVEKGKLTFRDGGVMIWNATHTNKQVEGFLTPRNPFDDVFQITGGAKGVSERNGERVEWSRVIAEPLMKSFKCRWIQKGIIHITHNNNKAILDFGNGTCDNMAVLTVNGERKEIKL